MNVKIVPAQDRDLPVVQNLARFYIYDMSEFMGWPCPESGLFGGCDEFFDDWTNGQNAPFILRVGDELAGFAGVKRTEDEQGPEYCIQEFFVLRKFRRQGVGRAAAIGLFDKHRGRWQVQQLAQNRMALVFWRAVIESYTDGAFAETHEQHPEWGEMNTIRFCNA